LKNVKTQNLKCDYSSSYTQCKGFAHGARQRASSGSTTPLRSAACAPVRKLSGQAMVSAAAPIIPQRGGFVKEYFKLI